MKNLFILFIAFGLNFQMIYAQQNTKSDEFETKKINLETFDAVEVSHGINVEIYHANENRAEISSNDMDYVKVKVSNGTLKIGYDLKANSTLQDSKTNIKVFARNIQTLEANSSGEIEAIDLISNESIAIDISSAGSISGNFKAENIRINGSSSGDFKGTIEAKTVDIKASSAVDIVCKGTTENLNIKASSSADVNTENLEAKFVKVKASSASDIKVYASHELHAKANSGADILYSTNDNLSKLVVNSTSGGEIKEK
ncbi:MAG: head GIN domain-containing protein [Weeksellaceae bacterium]